MKALLFTILFSLVFAYFATLNTEAVGIRFDGYVLYLPLYLVMLGSLLLGTLLATVIYFVHSFADFVEKERKEKVVSEMKKSLLEITRRLHQLEVKEEKLEEKNGMSNPIKEGEI